jgi:hypothetical protein
MTHIILIDDYLYNRYKELLSIRMLAANHQGMLAAWKYLASLAPADVYFAKILYKKEETACLNRNNFPLHISAAVAAARFEIPSMIHYRGAESQIQSSTIIGNIVNLYLTHRLRLAPRAMINEMAQFSSMQEVREYHRIVQSVEYDQVDATTVTQERGRPAALPPAPAASDN